MTDFVLIGSSHQCQVIKRFGPARDSYAASISNSYTEPAAEEYVREALEPATEEYVRKASESVTEASKDVGEACQDAIVPEAPTNLTFFTNYATHVVTFIWQHKVSLLRFKIFTY